RDARCEFYLAGDSVWKYLVLEADAELLPVAATPNDATVDALVEYYRVVAGEHPHWGQDPPAVGSSPPPRARPPPAPAGGFWPGWTPGWGGWGGNGTPAKKPAENTPNAIQIPTTFSVTCSPPPKTEPRGVSRMCTNTSSATNVVTAHTQRRHLKI